MKTVLSLLILIGMQAVAQTTGMLQNQKDGWDLSYTYIGELKNGKPNGMGIAIYPSGNAIRYVGAFVNGMYNGKGTMLFDDGAFLTGYWISVDWLWRKGCSTGCESEYDLADRYVCLTYMG